MMALAKDPKIVNSTKEQRNTESPKKLFAIENYQQQTGVATRGENERWGIKRLLGPLRNDRNRLIASGESIC
jgi:hypothetical protein